jgi:phenylacetate-CoA ligase
MIVNFAQFILEKGYPTISSLKSIITTSEILDPASREIIEITFGVKVFNEYGCGEVGSIAHECEYGNMHVMADNLIVEIDSRDSPDKKSGQVIVTDLHNYAMPLIRYNVGDYATLSSCPCKCGRGLPVLQKIHGRAYDVIIDPDGNRYHPEILMYIFEDLKSQNAGIKQFQVIQKDADHMIINIIPDSNFNESSEKLITNHINKDIHPAIRVDFNFTHKINREKSGKLRIIKSEM